MMETMTPLPPLLLKGDCLVELRRIPDESIDAIVTDPPYGLEFMGKDWDSFRVDTRQSGDANYQQVDNPYGRSKVRHGGARSYGGDNLGAMQQFELWCSQWAAECLRILKPGGHMLAFGGSRTWHRLAAGIEDAGFEIRDSIAWLYGSGFPKSLDVSKAIDKAAGATREVVGVREDFAARANKKRIGVSWADTSVADGSFSNPETVGQITAPVTDAARQWEGWGTALKPAFEPVVVARKPLTGTVAANVLAYGTGALNIDGARVGDGGQLKWSTPRGIGSPNSFADDAWTQAQGRPHADATESSVGRWPANVMLDESQAAELDRQAPSAGASGKASGPTLREATDGTVAYGARKGLKGEPAFYGDSGGASRFFYVAKAPKRERPVVDGVAHPTVKPLALMRYLVKLVTPPGGCVVDPFAGSGATLEAAYLEGFESIGVELTPEYWPLIQARIDRNLPTDDEDAA